MYKFSAIEVMSRLPEETLLKIVDSSHCLSQVAAWISLENLRRWGGNEEEHPDYCLDFTLFVSDHLDLEADFFCDYLVDLLVDLGRVDLLEKTLSTWYPTNYDGIKAYTEEAILNLKTAQEDPNEYLKDYLDLFKEIKKGKAFAYSQDDRVRFFIPKSMSLAELSTNYMFCIEAEESIYHEASYHEFLKGRS